MKKAVYFTLSLVTLALSSCQRDWTCVCTFNDGTNPNEMVIGNSNKDAAQATCDDFSGEAMNLGAECGLAE
jgi:hypothetical protein